MSQFESIFGSYASNLQVVIDTNLARFAPNWYPQYFDWAPQQQSLTFQSVIGRQRIEAMASVVNRDSTTPLRSRQALERLSGEIPAIAEMFKMSQSDYREFLSLQAINVDDAIKEGQLLDFLFDDVQKVGSSAHKRLDAFALEMVSTGYLTVTIGNNPDGTVISAPLEIGMPAENRVNAAFTWNNATTSTPITDIELATKRMKQAGKPVAKIMMSDALFSYFKQSKQVTDTLISFFYGFKTGGAASPVAVSTLEKINQYLSDNRLPVIEIVDEITGIEKDGKIDPYTAFSQTNAVLVPAGKLGKIKNALAIEQLRPVGKVAYGSFNRALISKWSENEPFGEWTKVELNAIPAVEAIDSISIITATF